MTISVQNPSVVILGAGIAGLSTATFLKEHGIQALVLEKGSTHGGLGRSFRWNGFWCDFAAHRLFTRDELVLDKVRALVPLIRHERRSQIYLGGAWLRDPIDAIELIRHLPPASSLRLIGSYLGRPRTLPEDSFEHYVLKRYGRHFYDFFFRPYTERLFSLPGDQIAVEWARLKVRLASPVDRFKRATKTKFNAFYYPTHGGYGAIADAMFAKVHDQVEFGARVTGFEWDASGLITSVCYEQDGEAKRVMVDHLISTLPLTLNARFLGVEIPLDYQKVDAVYLLLAKPYMTENHWLYFMDQASTINRIVEFKQMSSEGTVADQTVVCAEVTQDVADPVSAVIGDLIRSGMINAHEVRDTKVIREPFAYPRYTRGYPGQVAAFEQHLQTRNHRNFHFLGRAAQFEHAEVDDLIGAAHSFVTQMVGTTADLREDARRSEPALVAIVVLAWNNYADTAECLESLSRLTYEPYQIVLVDNGSHDDTPARIRAAFPDVVVIENGENLGVPAGYNVGFRYALDHGADHVFMLNNDTIVDPEILNHLVAAAQERDAGILHPVVYFYAEPDQIWSAGARYRSFPPAIVMESRLLPPKNGYHDLEYAISCGLLISRRAFEEVGLFDENFRFFWDDLDFAARVRRRGLRILQVSAAKMWHKVSRTTQPGSTLYWRVHGESSAIFWRRHGRNGYVTIAIHLGYFALREFIWKRRWTSLKPYVQGLRYGLTNQLKDVPRIEDEAPFPG